MNYTSVFRQMEDRIISEGKDLEEFLEFAMMYHQTVEKRLNGGTEAIQQFTAEKELWKHYQWPETFPGKLVVPSAVGAVLKGTRPIKRQNAEIVRGTKKRKQNHSDGGRRNPVKIEDSDDEGENDEKDDGRRNLVRIEDSDESRRNLVTIKDPDDGRRNMIKIEDSDDQGENDEKDDMIADIPPKMNEPPFVPVEDMNQAQYAYQGNGGNSDNFNDAATANNIRNGNNVQRRNPVRHSQKTPYSKEVASPPAGNVEVGELRDSDTTASYGRNIVTAYIHKRGAVECRITARDKDGTPRPRAVGKSTYTPFRDVDFFPQFKNLSKDEFREEVRKILSFEIDD